MSGDQKRTAALEELVREGVTRYEEAHVTGPAETDLIWWPDAGWVEKARAALEQTEEEK